MRLWGCRPYSERKKLRLSPTPLTSLFNARSVAFVGASSDPGKWGFLTLKHMIDGGFRGKLYPVTPREPEILGLKVTRNIADLPETPDLADALVRYGKYVN